MHILLPPVLNNRLIAAIQFRRPKKEIKHPCVQRGIGTALDAEQTQERDQSYVKQLSTLFQDKAQDIFKRRIKGKNIPLLAQSSASAPSAQPAADHVSIGTAPADVPRVSQVTYPCSW